MKRLFNNITRRGLQVILLAVSVLTVIGAAEAMPVEHYAANSRLASGRWRKVEVKTTGMQLITNAQLKTDVYKRQAFREAISRTIKEYSDKNYEYAATMPERMSAYS